MNRISKALFRSYRFGWIPGVVPFFLLRHLETSWILGLVLTYAASAYAFRYFTKKTEADGAPIFLLTFNLICLADASFWLKDYKHLNIALYGMIALVTLIFLLRRGTISSGKVWYQKVIPATALAATALLGATAYYKYTDYRDEKIWEAQREAEEAAKRYQEKIATFEGFETPEQATKIVDHFRCGERSSDPYIRRVTSDPKLEREISRMNWYITKAIAGKYRESAKATDQRTIAECLRSVANFTDPKFIERHPDLFTSKIALAAKNMNPGFDVLKQLEELESGIGRAKSTYLELKEEPANVRYFEGLMVGNKGGNIYEVVSFNGVRKLLHTVNTTFSSKGMSAMYVVSKGLTDVKLNENAGGFDTKWEVLEEYPGYKDKRAALDKAKALFTERDRQFASVWTQAWTSVFTNGIESVARSMPAPSSTEAKRETASEAPRADQK